ncbi:MAG: hypothetical protein GF355_15195 [Candidatus Eisenbacteria bacterium]|nr:hypothetical protein [Candidatus Eisenbacteria bacterium]
MARKRSTAKLRKGLLLFFASCLVGAYLLGYCGPDPGVRTKLTVCSENLKRIGTLLASMAERGDDIFQESGSRFLLQVAPEMSDEELVAFICPGDPGYAHLVSGESREELTSLYRKDWRSAPCSYRGPDAAFVQTLRSGGSLEGAGIIACDMNGPKGNEPYHGDRVIALLGDGRVIMVSLNWMREAYDGSIAVGPDSPDPRFRHLVP